MTSTFLSPGVVTGEGDVASLHLRRDHAIPITLSTVATAKEDQGYAEGNVTNTRFGSFPHSTLLGVPWGSQVRASKVDTGSRGRAALQNKKRKAAAMESGDISTTDNQSAVTDAITAGSGFLHVLPPTPESWTSSLPHRTQVVYTPDYSYVLHRIRARPGSRLIEAGSGSGSFTHAAARAVFDGYPSQTEPTESVDDFQLSKTRGHVFTYEFHAGRYESLKAEMKEHGLDFIVHATHRNVYQDGFLVENSEEVTKTSPSANAIFLDLPAPWEALPHLTRNIVEGKPSALDESSTVHICTFSPCIEQVQRTVSALRRHGWIEIEMVEMHQKREEVRREFTGLEYDGMRGVNPMAKTVEEALYKLRDMDQRSRDFHTGTSETNGNARLDLISANKQLDASKTLYKEGRLIHRSEPELKTHTSYLVFAVLPRLWTENDEEGALQKWSNLEKFDTGLPKSQHQLKKEAKQRNRHDANGHHSPS